MEQAERLNCERMLFFGIFLARELLGTAIPEEVLQRIQANQKVKTKRLRCAHANALTPRATLG